MKTEQSKSKVISKILRVKKLQYLLSSRKQPRTKKRFELNGQATKSARGMPWHQEPTKDAAICDKPRLAESRLRSVDFRMGKPGRAILCHHYVNKIA